MKGLLKIIHAAIYITLIVVIGCSPSYKRKSGMAIPPGLDSLTVVRSSKIADQNFVSNKRENRATLLTEKGHERLKKVDEFWSYLEKQEKKHAKLSSADQAAFNNALVEGAGYLTKWKSLSKSSKSRKYSQNALHYCQEAQRFFEEAVRINPFDKNTRLLLASTYYNLQHIFALQKNHKKSIQILERLTRLEKGEHSLFRLLADNYIEVKDYQSALRNFRRAEDVMLKIDFMATPDTAMLFYYNYGQGDALARLYQTPQANRAFVKAKTFARTDEEKGDIKNYLKWMNWDGGNIKAVVQWDKIIELESKKEYSKTASACKKLLPTLKTANAKMSVQHKLAVMEFEYLKQQGSAVERMKQVFDAVPAQLDKEEHAEEIKVYLNTYGAMLYRLGVEARKKEQKKTSLAYFSKAASFEWDNVARAYLEIVPLVWTTPEQAIKYGKLALANSDILSSTENCELMSLMLKAHKSAGLFDEARTYYTNWKNCKEKNL